MMKKSLLFSFSALLLCSQSTIHPDSKAIKQNQRVYIKTHQGYKRYFRIHIVSDHTNRNLKNQQTIALYNNRDGKKNYWSVQDRDNGPVEFNRTEIGLWEKFTIEKINGSEGENIEDGDTIALRSYKGYLSTQPNGKFEGNRGQIGPWEKFIITIESE